MTFVDFGGNIKGVEEVNLRWIKTCRTSRDCEINRSSRTDSCFSWYFVGFEFRLKLVDRCIGEDESNLVFEERNKSSEFWNNAPKVLFKMLELIFLDTFSSHLDDLLGEGVLIDYEMSTICSECLADLVDLAGAYVGEVG